MYENISRTKKEKTTKCPPNKLPTSAQHMWEMLIELPRWLTHETAWECAKSVQSYHHVFKKNLKYNCNCFYLSN